MKNIIPAKIVMYCLVTILMILPHLSTLSYFEQYDILGMRRTLERVIDKVVLKDVDKVVRTVIDETYLIELKNDNYRMKQIILALNSRARSLEKSLTLIRDILAEMAFDLNRLKRR